MISHYKKMLVTGLGSVFAAATFAAPLSDRVLEGTGVSHEGFTRQYDKKITDEPPVMREAATFKTTYNQASAVELLIINGTGRYKIQETVREPDAQSGNDFNTVRIATVSSLGSTLYDYYEQINDRQYFDSRDYKSLSSTQSSHVDRLVHLEMNILNSIEIKLQPRAATLCKKPAGHDTMTCWTF